MKLLLAIAGTVVFLTALAAPGVSFADAAVPVSGYDRWCGGSSSTSTLCYYAALNRERAAIDPAGGIDPVGNDILQHLGTLFVLDMLFRNNSDGLLDPNGVTLGNILILYQLFFAPAAP